MRNNAASAPDRILSPCEVRHTPQFPLPSAHRNERQYAATTIQRHELTSELKPERGDDVKLSANAAGGVSHHVNHAS